MKWLEERFTVGNVATILIVIVTSAFSVGGIYYTMSDDLAGEKKINTQQTESISEINNRLSEHIQENNDELRKIIGELDSRYVRTREFEQWQEGLNGRLDRMNDNLKELIDIQTRKYR